MARSRDMTLRQFRAALERHGISPRPSFLGYHRVTGGKGMGGTYVSALNAGTRRRDQLAYLLREQARELEREQAKQDECKHDDCKATGTTDDGFCVLYRCRRCGAEGRKRIYAGGFKRDSDIVW